MRNLGVRKVGLIVAGLSALTWLGAAHPLSRSVYARDLAEPAGPQISGDEIQGIPWTGQPGITETVAAIMARQRLAPKVDAAHPRPTKPEIELRKLLPPRRSPAEPSAAVSRWPILDRALATPLPYNPQTVGTSFLGAQLSEAGSPCCLIPPDSMGDVGPTQILVAINGRIKVFDKAGSLGGLNVTMDTFFNSVRNGVGTSDPHVRYDRLSGRWFITMLNVPAQGPNRLLIAMSSGPTIVDSSSFTFFQFRQDLVGPTPNSDTNGFADYDTLGVDRFALYIGVNIFDQPGTSFLGTTGFVVNKASLIAGTLSVTAFRQMANDGSGCPAVTGPLTPQGVNNDDPAATEGYFIGADLCFFSTLQVRRVANPGGSPSLSGNLTVLVPTTEFPINQVQPGGAPTLDALDDRFFAAAVHKNKITGASTLWTAHNIEVNASGVGQLGGGRNASRWYEIGSLTTTPALVQAGTLFDSAASNPFGYWIPSVAMSGQGHMALGASRASAVGGTGPASGHASISVAGRLRTDGLGATQPPTLAVDSDSRYDVNTSPQTDPERWGDYSQTVVDPNDDMTIWTFQEYANATNSYGVRAIRLDAPPPATPDCSVPAQVTSSPQNVTITGTSSSGSEFFDPGPDTGGPGYTRLTASVSGGTIVNSVTFNSPTSVTLNITVTSNGPKNVTITNPDGQSVVGTGCISVVAIPVDLSITKTDGQATAPAGSPVTYTITAGNAGPGTVTGAAVVDNFPASLTGVAWTCVASAGSSCGAASGSGNINQLVNLLVGGTATFTATGTLNVSATGTLSNTASVTATGGYTDPNLGNNSATDTDTIIPAADLSITKTDGRTTTGAGSPVTYTITVSNAGPGNVTGATVTDNFPASLTGVTWTCTASAGSSCAAPSGSGNINQAVNLLVGGTATFVATGTLDINASGTLSNTATVSSGNPDPNPANNSATDTDTIIPAADLSITKTDGKTTTGAGSPVTYTITVSNAGPGSVTGATVTDNFPASLTGVTWTCTASAGSSCAAPNGSGNINQTVNLLVGGTATFVATGTLDINASGTLSNTATVSSVNTDPNPANNSATDTDTIILAADLSITKTDGRSTASAGNAITYTIVATNNGPTAVTGATVTDTPPASLLGAAWTCAPAGGATCTGSGTGNINDTVNLPVGATVTYTLSGTVSGSATSLSNTATITAPASVNDPNAANNTATDMDILLCTGVTVVVPDGRLTQATLAAGVTAWFGASLKIGDSYSVEFKNTTEGVPPGTLTVFKGDDGCAGSSTLTTNDTSAIDPSGTGGIVRSSFTATGAQTFFQARLVNTTGSPVTLTFGWSDTTQFSPAWSTNGSFDTFFSFLNTTSAPLSGTLTLLDTAGAVLSTFPLSVPAGQAASTNTSALGVTRNRTGTTKFVHNGPPGSIVTEAAIANFTISPAYVQPVKFQPVRDAK